MFSWCYLACSRKWLNWTPFELQQLVSSSRWSIMPEIIWLACMTVKLTLKATCLQTQTSASQRGGCSHELGEMSFLITCAQICTDLHTCWNSRCTLQCIFQEPVMTEPCFNLLYTLPGANEFPCSIRIYHGLYLSRKKCFASFGDYICVEHGMG